VHAIWALPSVVARLVEALVVRWQGLEAPSLADVDLLSTRSVLDYVEEAVALHVDLAAQAKVEPLASPPYIVVATAERTPRCEWLCRHTPGPPVAVPSMPSAPAVLHFAVSLAVAA